MDESILKSGLLLAMPRSSDPNLSGAVLLLVEHGAQRSLTLVINRPSPVAASELLASLNMTWRGRESAVVDHPRTLARPRERPSSRDPYLAGQHRLAVGQLAGAMSRGGVYTEASPDLVFDTAPDLLWKRVQSIGAALPDTGGGLSGAIRRLLGKRVIPRAIMRRR
jgi:putative AlgH/UPF0301 family transcriptional regulator